MKDLDSSILALNTFQQKITTLGLEAAVQWARAAGFYVRPELLPTPISDKRAEIVSDGDPMKTAIFDSVGNHRDGLRSEQAAVAMASAISNGGDALDRLTTKEKVDAIMTGRAGLGPLASVNMLKDLGEIGAAREYEQRNFTAVHGERLKEEAEHDAARASRDIEVRREEARRRVISQSRSNADAMPIMTAELATKLDAINQQFDAEQARVVSDVRAALQKRLDNMACFGAYTRHY